MSKYMLQCLFYLKDNKPLTQGNLIAQMHRWQGTGKYSAIKGVMLGSATSKLQIIENLKSLSLIDILGKELIKISKKGEIFLNKLHKDCKDLDLPFRIEEWSTLSFDEAKEKIDKYIYHFFGKQKRKMNAEIL